jgi:hypothetical protein
MAAWTIETPGLPHESGTMKRCSSSLATLAFFGFDVQIT